MGKPDQMSPIRAADPMIVAAGSIHGSMLERSLVASASERRSIGTVSVARLTIAG